MENEIPATDSAISLAQENGVDLSEVEHEGEKITQPDVKKHIAEMEKGDESTEEPEGSQKCKFCLKTGPPVYNNRKEARCGQCYEKFPAGG